MPEEHGKILDFKPRNSSSSMRAVRLFLNWVAFITIPLWILPVFLFAEWSETKRWASGKEWLWS